MLAPFFDPLLFGRPFAYRGQFEESGQRTVVRDNSEAFVFAIELPGFAPEDVKVDVTREKLTVVGERKAATVEGYHAHRRERLAYNFSRAYTLPVPVDAEHATAAVKNGVLTVTLPKVAEVRPRSIPVSAAN